MTDFLSTVMAELNSNLAVGRRTIEQMMDSKDYSYKTKDGSQVIIPEEQMTILWSICDNGERIRLKLPIFVSTDTSYETGAWKVEGKDEAAVVSRLLGKTLLKEGYLRLYHPDLKDLRKKIPDAIMVVFRP